MGNVRKEVSRFGVPVRAGGYHGTVKQECWLFDVREKKWKPLPSMLRARCKHTSLVHGDYVYVIGELCRLPMTSSTTTNFSRIILTCVLT